MKTLPVLAAALFALALTAWLPRPAAAMPITYQFDLIADNSGAFLNFRAPSLNNSGTAAFFAFLDPIPSTPPGTFTSGIFTVGGGATTTIADTSGAFVGFSQLPTINDSGTTAFFGVLDAGGRGIFTGAGGATTTIADTSGAFSDFSPNPSINGSGTTAFQANLDAGGSGIFTGAGGATSTIADTSGAFAGFTNPTIKDSGTTAFFAFLDTGVEGAFTVAGGATTTIADTSGAFLSLGRVPSINDSGTAAFFANLDAGGSGIFTSAGGAATTIADTSGVFSRFIDAPSINNSGTVVFAANFDAGGAGIFTGADPIDDKVIAVGDFLAGSTVTGFSTSQGLNDLGQIAFLVGLANGTQGIVIATPEQVMAEVPEPASLALFALGLTGLGFFGWRREHRELRAGLRVRLSEPANRAARTGGES